MSVRMVDVLFVVGYFAVGTILIRLLSKPFRMFDHDEEPSGLLYCLIGLFWLLWPVILLPPLLGLIVSRLVIGKRKR